VQTPNKEQIKLFEDLFSKVENENKMTQMTQVPEVNLFGTSTNMSEKRKSTDGVACEGPAKNDHLEAPKIEPQLFIIID
jgi:hypothetical protein